ncbi:MAG: NAD-binding protein [Geminicoccaceae bacterium]|nr:NAD-binding protein [Geminicoccaceae bacterium]
MSDQACGFVGLGSMGLAMAVNLVRAGFELRGYDIAAVARERLVQAGGVAVGSVAEVADGQSLLLVVVARAEQAESVLFGGADAVASGEGGAVAALAPGATVVLHSTVSPAYARDLGERLAVAGHRLLDAPISGGRVGAEGGNLSIMASGSPAAFDAAARAFEVMAGRVYRLGDEPGTGSTVKMINQHLAGVHIAAAAEAMALGTRAGADPATLFEVISGSAGNSWMFSNRVPHMLERDFSPRSAVEIFVKDLGIVLETGKELRFPLPIAASAHQQYLAAAAGGHGGEDDAAVVKVYERLADIEVKG